MIDERIIGQEKKQWGLGLWLGATGPWQNFPTAGTSTAGSSTSGEKGCEPLVYAAPRVKDEIFWNS